MKARVARLCQPGPMWYLAVCEACRWADMSWKQRSWAILACDQHNKLHHRSEP